MTVRRTLSEAPPSRTRLDEVRARLASLTRSVRAEADPSRAERLLGERAQKLAASRSTVHSPTTRLIVFDVGHARHALPAASLVGVLRGAWPTPLPATSRIVRGVVAFRGSPLVVFDAAAVLGDSISPQSEGEVLVLGETEPELGLFVDRVEAVEEQPVSDLADLPRLTASNLPLAVLGVTADGLVLLDPEALLRDERLYVRSATP